MLVYIWIGTKAAVMAGKTTSGALPVTITEEWLTGLTTEERAVLAEKVKTEPEKSPGQFCCLNIYGPELVEATPETALQAVRALVQDAREKAEKKRKDAEEVRAKCAAVLAERRTKEERRDFASVDVRADGTVRVADYCGNVGCKLLSIDWPYYTDPSVTKGEAAEAWKAEIEAENERRKAAALEVAKAAALAKWEAERAKLKEESAKRSQFQAASAALVEQIGTEDQRGRLDDGLLPVTELEQIARDHVFTPLAEFARYERLTANDVEHDGEEDDCYPCGGAVEFNAGEALSLDAEPWRNLKAIEKAAPEGAAVKPRCHTATCDKCEAETERFSALVSIEWHGRQFSREYAI